MKITAFLCGLVIGICASYISQYIWIGTVVGKEAIHEKCESLCHVGGERLFSIYVLEFGKVGQCYLSESTWDNIHIGDSFICLGEKTE